MEEAEFRDVTKKALTRQKLGALNFVYGVEKRGRGSLELTWKKHIISDNIKFLLGSVTLSLCRKKGAEILLDFAVSALEEKTQVIDDFEKETARLASERQGALARLEKCANLQEDIEKDLFGKFTMVLNEKKAKIRRLMEQLSSLSQQVQELQQSRKKAEAPPTPQGGSEDAPVDQSDNETDDEMAHSPSPLATEKRPRLSPTPSSGAAMESLLGDPSDCLISSPPVRRRKRNTGRTPTSKVKGQPVELLHPSIRKSSSSMSSETVRVQASSSESKKSDESMESDDLLQLL